MIFYGYNTFNIKILHFLWVCNVHLLWKLALIGKRFVQISCFGYKNLCRTNIGEAVKDLISSLSFLCKYYIFINRKSQQSFILNKTKGRKQANIKITHNTVPDYCVSLCQVCIYFRIMQKDLDLVSENNIQNYNYVQNASNFYVIPTKIVI